MASVNESLGMEFPSMVAGTLRREDASVRQMQSVAESSAGSTPGIPAQRKEEASVRQMQ